MKKMINIRNSIIIVLCMTIILMAIGFIVLAVEYNKNAKKAIFDTSFVKVKEVSYVKGGKTSPVAKSSITNRGKEINLNMTLSTSYDQVTYTILIRNDGTLPSEIIDIKEQPDYNIQELSKKIEPITITHSDVIGKILQPGEEIELKVSASYNVSSINIKKNVDYQLALITATPEE